MDRMILVEYADMKEEIKDLRKRIEKDERALEKLNKEIVADIVSYGRKGKKNLGTAKIEGRPKIAIQKRKKAYKKKLIQLEQFELELLEKQTEVEQYIQQIEKSELRIMFRLYYIDDFPWYKVAIEMNRIFPQRKIKYTEDNCKQRHKRYFDKL